VPYAEDRELVMEILKFGADVEVVVPGRLRARVASALKAAAQRYPCAGGGTDDTPSPMKSKMTP
jgi:predicted DNA-binding transcriptional regulator YafY